MKLLFQTSCDCLFGSVWCLLSSCQSLREGSVCNLPNKNKKSIFCSYLVKAWCYMAFYICSLFKYFIIHQSYHSDSMIFACLFLFQVPNEKVTQNFVWFLFFIELKRERTNNGRGMTFFHHLVEEKKKKKEGRKIGWVGTPNGILPKMMKTWR